MSTPLSPLSSSSPSSIGWVDLLRIFACFIVVLAHCCDPFVAQLNNNRPEMLAGVAWGSLVRPCVPLFVMISGVLLLPTLLSMGDFYKKRLKRLLIPLIAWSLITPLIYGFYFSQGVLSTNPNIVLADHSWVSSFQKMGLFIFNFSYDTIPFWYLYMLVGLYLIIPIISPWVIQASQKDLKRFLYIWGVSMCLPYIQMAAPALGYKGNGGDFGLLGVCAWNPYGTFYYFSGFLGYLVLAHYLVKYPLHWSWKRTLSTALPLFLIGYAVTLTGFLVVQRYYVDDYKFLEIFWYFSGINVFMMTFASFIVLQKIKVPSLPVLRKLANLTFGVYLCHFFIVQWSYDTFYRLLPIPAPLQIPLLALITFSLSLILVWILSKIPGVRRLV